jgi:glycosyltransferase involved in cell wall biosynthesis
MGKVLMVSWLFPPHTSIGAKRAYRFARCLPSQGWGATVVCRRKVPAAYRDVSEYGLPDGVQVCREYDAAVFERFASDVVSPSSDAPQALQRPFAARINTRFNELIDAVVPTETVSIHAPHAARVIDRLLPSHDVLWTTSYPYHSHWLGVRAARKHRKPLVVDLRDPWTPNWVHRKKFLMARSVEAWLEREVFAAADAIVVTTWALEALYRTMFPQWAHKFLTIHNAFDEAPATIAPASSRTFRMVHFGNVYGPWSFETLFRALSLLQREGAFHTREVVFENYGKLSDRDRDLAVTLGIRDHIRVCETVSWAEGIQRLSSASLLMLAAWNDPDARLYVPGKLFDYLTAGVAVVAETVHEDVSRIVTESKAGVVIAPGDVTAMADVIRRALTGDVTLRGATRESAHAFSAPEATRKLANLLNQVVEKKS